MLNDPKFMKELEDLSANFTPLADQTWEELYGDVKDKFVTRNEFMEANIAKRLAKREEEAARKAARANKNK